jgi:hypothetical protein
MSEKMDPARLSQAYLRTAASAFALCRIAIRAAESHDTRFYQQAAQHLDQAEAGLRGYDPDVFSPRVDALLSMTIQRERVLDLEVRKAIWAAAMGLYFGRRDGIRNSTSERQQPGAPKEFLLQEATY